MFTEHNDSDIRDTLLKARSELTTRGVGRGAFHDKKTGKVCSLGAIMLACGLSEDELDPMVSRSTTVTLWPKYRGAVRRLAGDTNGRFEGCENLIINCNDESRSDDTVFQMFDHAIEKLSQSELVSA